MNRIARIGIELIPDYFPELQEEQLFFEIRPHSEQGMFYAEDRNNIGHHIVADPLVATLPKEIVTGWTAHELAHCVQYLHIRQEGNLSKIARRHHAKPTYKALEERETDEEVIRRGLGIQLLACNSWILSRNALWQPEYGLHPDEIKAILSKGIKNRGGEK